MSTTRNKTNCPILGPSLDLSSSGTMLPTREQVLRYYNFIRQKKKQSVGQYKPKVVKFITKLLIRWWKYGKKLLFLQCIMLQ